jgi:hypothetical protein
LKLHHLIGVIKELTVYPESSQCSTKGVFRTAREGHILQSTNCHEYISGANKALYFHSSRAFSRDFDHTNTANICTIACIVHRCGVVAPTRCENVPQNIAFCEPFGLLGRDSIRFGDFFAKVCVSRMKLGSKVFDSHILLILSVWDDLWI